MPDAPPQRSAIARVQKEIRRIPANIAKRLHRWIPGWDSGLALRHSVLRGLPFFAPDASARGRKYGSLTLRNALGYPESLARVMAALDGRNPVPPAPVRVEEIPHDESLAGTLAGLFARHGSDKHHHNYPPFYADVLSRLGPDKPLRVLEIGLGTTDPKVPSNMGRRGTPGASVRAWRDALPAARVYGADIDRAILFSEPRIKTAWVDQMDPGSFAAMCRDLGEDAFDLIVDDGLHCQSANLNVLAFALGALRPGGYLVTEDIWPWMFAPWSPVFALLQRHSIPCGAVRTKSAYIFWMRRP